MRLLYPRFGRLFARQTSEILLVVDGAMILIDVSADSSTWLHRPRVYRRRLLSLQHPEQEKSADRWAGK